MVESKLDPVNEMDRLHAEYNALCEAARNDMTFTEYCGLKTRGIGGSGMIKERMSSIVWGRSQFPIEEHRRKGYEERKDIQHVWGRSQFSILMGKAVL